MMKRPATLVIFAMLLLGLCGSVAASGALLVILPEHRALAPGEQVAAYYIGQVKLGEFEPMDSDRISLDGKPLDDELRYAWAEAPGTMELTTDLITYGQQFQLTWDSGSASVIGLDYNYAAASDDDHLSVILELNQELPERDWLVFALAGSSHAFFSPTEMAITETDSPDGGYVIYELDIDGDDVIETLMWDRRAASAMDDEGVTHPLILSRGETRLQTLAFFYDDDYTYPLDPEFIDLDGDGVYELILSGHGHNTYVSVYRFENDAFVETGIRFYSGD